MRTWGMSEQADAITQREAVRHYRARISQLESDYLDLALANNWDWALYVECVSERLRRAMEAERSDYPGWSQG